MGNDNQERDARLPVVVYGCGGHGKVVLEILLAAIPIGVIAVGVPARVIQSKMPE